jgi:hypothetical protein
VRRRSALLAVGLVARAFLIWFVGSALPGFVAALGRPANLGDRVVQVGILILLLTWLAYVIWGGVNDIRAWLRERGGPSR